MMTGKRAGKSNYRLLYKDPSTFYSLSSSFLSSLALDSCIQDYQLIRFRPHRCVPFLILIEFATILKGRPYKTPSLNSLFSQGGTPWTPPSLRWLFLYLKAYKITATSCIKTHLRLRKKAGEMEITSGLVRIRSIPGHVTVFFQVT